MFIITKDYIDDGEAVGTMGPRSISDEDERVLKSVASGVLPEGIKATHFFMYDADGIRYYGGWYIETANSNELEPLDCFGMPNAGATTIKVRINGEYCIV